jgi:hypothetical protein
VVAPVPPGRKWRVWGPDGGCTASLLSGKEDPGKPGKPGKPVSLFSSFNPQLADNEYLHPFFGVPFSPPIGAPSIINAALGAIRHRHRHGV